MTGSPGPAAERLGARDLALGLAAGTIVVGLLLAGGGIWDHVDGGDLHGMFLPRYEAAARAIDAGHLPLWTPNELCGMPLLATEQGSALYPPVLLLFGLLSPFAALHTLYGLHVFLLTTATCVYLRGHGIGAAGALIAVMVTVLELLGPHHPGLAHPSFLLSVAWVPVVFLTWERALDDLRWIGGLGLAVGLQWLCGYPEFAMVTAVLLLVIALLRGRPPLGRRLAVAGAGLALGAAIAAAQLLPLAEAVRESLRSEQTAYYARSRTHLALDLRGIPNAVAAYPPAALLLALTAVRAVDRRAVAAWAAASCWCLLAFNQPFALLYRLPPFSGVRLPYAFPTLAHFFVGCLAAAGAAALARAGALQRALAVVLGLLVLGPGALDLVAAPTSGWVTAPDQAQIAARGAALANFQRQFGDAAVVADLETKNGAPLRTGLRTAGGYEPAVPPRRIAHLLQAAGLSWTGSTDFYRLAAHADLASRLGVGMVVINPMTAPPHTIHILKRAGFAEVGRLPEASMVLRRPAVQRARLVHRAAVAVGEDASLAAVLAEGGDPSQVVLEVPAPPLAVPASDRVEAATVVAEQADRVEVDASVAAPALLVLTDTWFPGWEARVDGMTVPVLVADHAFRGVGLSPGEHRVVFVYDPASVRVGIVISVVALGVAVVSLAIGRSPAASRAA